MFLFSEKVSTYELLKVVHVVGDDKQVAQHKTYIMRAYMLYFVGTAIFVDKSVSYVDVISCDTSMTLSGSMSTTRGPLVWSTCTQSYQKVVCGRENR